MAHSELLARIPILRTGVRLRQRDLMWKQLCEELGWTFKATALASTKASAKARSRKKEKEL